MRAGRGVVIRNGRQPASPTALPLASGLAGLRSPSRLPSMVACSGRHLGAKRERCATVDLLVWAPERGSPAHGEVPPPVAAPPQPTASPVPPPSPPRSRPKAAAFCTPHALMRRCACLDVRDGAMALRALGGRGVTTRRRGAPGCVRSVGWTGWRTEELRLRLPAESLGAATAPPRRAIVALGSPEWIIVCVRWPRGVTCARARAHTYARGWWARTRLGENGSEI